MANSDENPDGKDNEHRRHTRIWISSKVRAVQDNTTYQGRVKDISLSGAAVEMDGELDDEHLVELHIEDLADLTGHVARTIDDGFAFTFDPDEIDEDPFLCDIMRLHDDMLTEDQ